MGREGRRSLLNPEYIIPLFVCTIATIIIMLVSIILMSRQIRVWSKNGEKQESLRGGSTF